MKVYRAQGSGDTVFFHVEGACEPPGASRRQQSRFDADSSESPEAGVIRWKPDSVSSKISREA